MAEPIVGSTMPAVRAATVAGGGQGLEEQRAHRGGPAPALARAGGARSRGGTGCRPRRGRPGRRPAGRGRGRRPRRPRRRRRPWSRWPASCARPARADRVAAGALTTAPRWSWPTGVAVVVGVVVVVVVVGVDVAGVVDAELVVARGASSWWASTSVEVDVAGGADGSAAVDVVVRRGRVVSGGTGHGDADAGGGHGGGQAHGHRGAADAHEGGVARPGGTLGSSGGRAWEPWLRLSSSGDPGPGSGSIPPVGRNAPLIPAGSLL